MMTYGLFPNGQAQHQLQQKNQPYFGRKNKEKGWQICVSAETLV
jgi:hypothetical protein